MAVAAAAPAQVSWFDEARLGLFIHWGTYSVAARHEWVMERERIPADAYEHYADVFRADLYDPRDWVRTAVAMGAEYLVVTTKHHEGFALWDTDVSDYSAARRGPQRDLLRPLLDEARAAGLRVGLYHSLLDWHHPDFPIDRHHPERGSGPTPPNDRDGSSYTRFLHAQVTELLTGYGRIDYLFFDFTYEGEDGLAGKGPADWRSEELMALVRELQPGIIVNDRLGIPGDLVTPEQYQPASAPLRDGQPVRWEACQTLNGSWGYDRDNTEFKSADLLVRTLVDTVSKGGNLLLNVGPDARGRIAGASRSLLEAIGEWMSLHEQAIRGAGAAEFTPPPDCRYTRRGDRLYLHVFAWPLRHLHLPGLAGRVRFACFVNDGSEVGFVELPADQQAWNTTLPGMPPGTLTLTLPVRPPDVLVPVIELHLT